MSATTQSEVSNARLALEESMTVSEPSEIVSGQTLLKSSERDLTNALLIVLVPVVAIEMFFHANAKAMWFDEVLTIFVSTQAHVSGIWDLLRHGVDGHPPTFYLIERLMSKLGGNERITFRLPAFAGFFCSMTCVFVFVRRRAGSIIALISTSALLLTNLFSPFAFEARSYGLMVASIAVALLCYDRVESRLWAFLFALSLAAACAFHFYGAISFFPFGLAELTYLVTEHRFRTRVWSAFLAGGLPYLAFWPILHEQKLLYGAHFWAVPTFWNFALSLEEVLQLPMGFSLAVFAAAIIYLIHLTYTGKFRERPTGSSGSGFSLSDTALTIGFLAIPAVTYVLAIIGHGGVSGRYVVSATLGVSLLVSLVMSRLKKPAILSIGLVVLFAFAFQEAAFWRYELRPREVKDAMELPMKAAEKLNLPVVISDPLQYLTEWHRASSEFKARLFVLADPQAQYSASGSDTGTLLLLTLKNYAPIQVQTFSEFAPNHRKFLVFSNGDRWDYWPRWLILHGYTVTAIDVDPQGKGVLEDSDPIKAILYSVDLDERK